MKKNYFKIIAVAMSLLIVTIGCKKDDPDDSEWIEINGVKWAKRNVAAPGTFTSKPEDAGMFYQWNCKTGWSSTDPLTSSTGGTTWDGSTPEGNSWEAANDPCPTGWRVPTLAEQESLISSGSDWAPLNGVNGRFFGNGIQKVFLPAAGYRSSYDGTLTYVRYNGYYWNNAPNDKDYAYYMGFSSGPVSTNSYPRNNGFSVRCVAE